MRFFDSLNPAKKTAQPEPPVERRVAAPQNVDALPAANGDEAALRAENTELRLQLKKANRNLAAMQNKLFRFDQVSGTRDRLAIMLKAEQSRQERYLNMMLENSPDIIIMLDNRACFAYCTNAFLKLVNVKSFGLIDGWYFLEVIKLLGDEGFLQDAQESLLLAAESTEPVTNYRTLEVARTGEVRSFITSTAAVHDASGTLDAYITVFHDVTEINKARVEAENANRAKSEFLANVSHELRTPLNAVNGLAELELRKNLPRPTLNNLEKIYGSGVTLLNIINDILDISKIESGRFELVPMEYDVASLISDTVSMNLVRIGSKPITFNLDVDAQLPTRLYGDELRVKQVMNNVLSNAIKYTTEGLVSLSISAEITPDMDCWLIFKVVDSGIGIAKENISKLFTEYSQVDPQSHRAIEGTGLGLFITKQLVDLMGGAITVESELGKGSTFAIRLKQTVTDERPIGEDLSENLASFRYFEGRSRHIKNIDYVQMPFAKVLIVDDVLTNLEVAKGMMDPYGMTVHTAMSGRQAVELVRDADTRYDIIFMDHMMPEMDGIQAARIIREDIGTEYAKNVPIVALTANAIVGIENMFLENGCQGFLTKPIDILKLDAVLHTWIWNRRKGESLEETEAKVPTIGLASTNTMDTEAILRENPLEGVDFAAGLKRFNNSATIYMRIVHSFIESTPKTLAELRSVDKDSLNEYSVRVHGLKGACYGIDALACGDAARALELAAKDGDYATVARDNAALIARVESLIEQFELIEEKIAKAKAQFVDVRPTRAAPDPVLLRALLAATQRFDIEEMQRHIDDLDASQYTDEPGVIGVLRKHFTNFNYDDIEEKITELLKGTD